MVAELRYVVAHIGAGWIGVVASAQGLLRLTLPQPSVSEVKPLLGAHLDLAAYAPDAFADLLQRLRRYFHGEVVTFTDELDLSSATVFQRKVWAQTRLIPYGETRTYHWVAAQVGQPVAARAVGQALARNPLPIIIPCHRVVAADGKLGGYSGGVGLKQELILLERTVASGQGAI